MTFATELARADRTLWWGVEVSLDAFATIAYRWATHAGDVEGQFFERRIVSLGNIQRGLGNNHLPVASEASFVIDNTDFGVDWLASRAGVEGSLLKARFRVKCGLAAPGSGTIITQAVGTFVCLDFPRRKDGGIQLSLADDSMGLLSDCLVPPTPRDWFDTAPGTTNSVFPSNVGNVEPLCDWDLPAPLQFGRSPHLGIPLCTFSIDRTPVDFKTADDFSAGHRKYIYPILVCATRSTATAAATDVNRLQGVFRSDVQTDPLGYATKGPLDIPTMDGAKRIWKAYKTDTITKDGYDWKLLWIAFDVVAYMAWLNGGRVPSGGGTPVVEVPSSPEYQPATFIPINYNSTGSSFPFAPLRTHFAAFDRFIVSGAPMSNVTGISDLATVSDACNIMQDFVEQYSAMGVGAIDSARFTRARLTTTIVATGGIFFGDAFERGTGQDQQLTNRRSPYGIGTLRRAIAELAASADLDVFVTMDGKVAVVTQGADFETQTAVLPAIDEARTNNVEDHIPSQGERWSPYNRIFLAGGNAGQAGPYDEPSAITSWGRIFSKVIGAKWWWNFNYVGAAQSLVGNVWNYRNLEAVIRPVLSFTTDVAALALELGDYFTASWTRGGQNTVFAGSIFRLESVRINPERGAVDVVAVWMDDFTTTNPFLLDSETLIVRTTPAFGQTCTVTDGSLSVTFSAGVDLVSDGVARGDILRLRDTSEAATGFTRNRDVMVWDVTSSTTLDLRPTSDVDFGTAGAHVIADTDWKIVRGATTYPTSVSDPTNYPSNGAMYGKVGDSSGRFSDTTDANRLV